jgi:hypothetical protein
MEVATRIAWLLLALAHVAPAVVLFRPGLVEGLYGASPTGDSGVLLVHRGALFLGVVVAALVAAVDPGARRLASLVVGISMIGFLVVYLRAGAPAGPLRRVAIVDAAALLPLAWVAFEAWRRREAG